MNLSETLRLALSCLSANKLRSALTMLGIAVGVFSVIGVMTVITALRGSIETGLNWVRVVLAILYVVKKPGRLSSGRWTVGSALLHVTIDSQAQCCLLRRSAGRMPWPINDL